MAKRLHVVPYQDQWAIRPEGSSSVSSVHPTQAAAIDQAKIEAVASGGEVTIHRPNGQIRDSDSYGNDPNPPKDTKH